MACSEWTRITLHGKSQNHPYASSIASSASSSSSSIFSATDSVSSQCSAPSSSQSSVNGTWEPYDTLIAQLESPESPHHLSRSNSKPTLDKHAPSDVPIPLELRQHPRRTQPSSQLGASHGASTGPCARPPPSLVRQCDRACNFVENLVGKLEDI